MAACGVVAWILGAGATAAAAVGEEHSLSQKAVEIARPFGFPVTNSMVVTWIVAVGLIVFAQLATRSMKQVPDGAQNFLEWLDRKPLPLSRRHHRSASGPIGRSGSSRTIFIFILAANWVGLIPGVGSIGWGHQTPEGFRLERTVLPRRQCRCQPDARDGARLLRAAGSSGPSAKTVPKGFAKELFAPKGESAGALRLLLIVVFFAAGCLEVISILFRPVSLSFRLYGNIFAGETMLETMAAVPSFGWLVQIPFYFMELLVGLVQALVFMLLTAVFTLLICQHHEEDRDLRRCATITEKGARKDT